MTDEVPHRRDTVVWDAPIRLFHWGLVLAVAGAWASIEFFESLTWHRRFGYGALALLLFRVGWGFWGSETARFLQFVKGPTAVWAYLRQGQTGIGHNPLGGVAVLVLLGLVLVQTVSGLFTVDDLGFDGGPFYDRVAEGTARTMRRLHHSNFDILLAMISLHVAAVLFYLFFKRDNLIRPMITGRKLLPSSARPPLLSPVWRAALLFAAAVAGVVVLVGS